MVAPWGRRNGEASFLRWRAVGAAGKVALMAEGDPEAPKGPRIQLQMDEQTSLGRYSNLVLINHTENEFLLDFAFLQPGNPKAKVVARIISSPKHTKRLLRALQKNLERFEERFGEIDVGEASDEPIVH
jgi:Protein of unknown function (DUF3467)